MAEQALDIRAALQEWAEPLRAILQNRLLDEAALLRFAKDRGIPAAGVGKGDPGKMLDLGWLVPDGSATPERPLFHPFRVYPIFCVLQLCRLPIAASSSIDRAEFPGFLLRVAEGLPPLEAIGETAARANRVADLAVILEPLYWPTITSITTWRGEIELGDHEQLVEAHRANARGLLETLDPAEWQEIHSRVRQDASRLDPNGELYLLLRLAPWARRERLKGKVSGAMWMRHMAEVIRRGFEEVHGVQWPEEDHDHGHWFPGARERIYGSDRPLDQPVNARRYVALEFGLHTRGIARWYLEGETEYYAAREILPGAAIGGIELINLKGAIAQDKPNAALRFADLLGEDRRHHRFSIISFDLDVPANVRTIRRQIQNGNVVGYVDAHDPDFEFANFSLQELVEVAALLDESLGCSADGLRQADWSGVTNGRSFEERYRALSARKPRSLKGQEWGGALAAFAMDFPDREDTGARRPFLEAVDVALRARAVRYDDHRDSYRLDPNTFALIRRQEP
ncbi:MAG: hypothetical protein IRY91_09500 [Gemmatimonadaceae bacterium]|nr:hypothetical protein [Gemmatimonadaceae bacterium]